MNKRVCLFSIAVSLIALLAGSSIAGVAGQSALQVTVDLVLYEGNPVLVAGEVGAWDAGGVSSPQVIYHNGLFHMLYTGRDTSTPIRLAVGYATSEDGFNWTRYEDNPVFALDESFGNYGAEVGALMVEGDTWVMLVSPHFPSTSTSDAPNWGKIILRATAPDPTGPWTLDPTPVLEAGQVGDWDYSGIAGGTVVSTGAGYILYYANEELQAYGMATSEDGITWVKYNDPLTTTSQFDASDPVFTAAGPDLFLGSKVVRRHGEDGWEMFYTGGSVVDEKPKTAISYATSPDGIHWTRYANNPILDVLDAAHHHPVVQSVVVVDDTYYMYYGEWYDWRVGVATGTVTWE
jgi:sucrose-6-phosphate hydrolase SacC (GH32 family)